MHKIEFNNDLDACIQGRAIYVKPDVTTLSKRKMERLARIAELQRYYQRNPVRFISDFFNIELLDYQRWILQNAWTCPNVLLVVTRGAGKPLDKETPILTPQGWRRFGDLKCGDQVFGSDGKSYNIIGVSDTFYNRCFEITFSDNEKIVCNEDHVWAVFDEDEDKDVLVEHEAKWIFANFENSKRTRRFSVPMAKPLEYLKKDLKVDPYILGLWLGDGCKNKSVITCSETDCDEVCSLIKERKYIIHSVSKFNTYNYITVHCPDGTPLITKLKEIGLGREKYIPDDYLTSSVEDRLLLFRGLMDTDGCVSKDSFCEFAQNNISHAKLSIGFEQLLNSLGIKHTNKCNKRTYFHKGEKKESTAMRFLFSADKTLPPFKLKRKYDRLKDQLSYRTRRKYITAIKEIDPVPTSCITIDSPDGLFVCGRKNTVTHNSLLIDLLLMAKGMLFNNYWTYIASGSGAQAQQTFATLENLANDNISTMVGSTGYIFKNEVVVPRAGGDGFSHSADGHTYKLNNGSMTQTLNSNVDSQNLASIQRVAL